jgi:DDE family transposase
MSARPAAGRLRPHARSLTDCLREFLTPTVYKQAHQAYTAGRRPGTRSADRWDVQPLVLTLILLTWCTGDSQAERFQTARAACVACLGRRRRPGQTVAGFHKALARLPHSVLRAVAAGVRQRLQALLDLRTEGFVVLGCDGSLLECPRSAELEARLGDRGKGHSAPTLWVTALVHLRSGVLWAWQLGRGTASERQHLHCLLKTLPASALVVADAGFSGYELAEAVLDAGASFLIRATAKDTFYLDAPADQARWTEGVVYAWPQTARRARQRPLPLRLIRVRSRRRKHDVWLVTNLLDSARLPGEVAGRYYRWRWENEGLFRTYKRTLHKVKLATRTLRLVHREAEGALLGTQLLLAQGARALPRRQNRRSPRRCSPRRVLCVLRQELQAAAGRQRRIAYSRRLACARREHRRRSSAKEKRVWPRRVPHKVPKPPHLLTLNDEQKALRAKLEGHTS